MRRFAACLLVSLVLLSGGCAGLSGLGKASPLLRDRTTFVLPAAAELTAVVTMASAGTVEEYLLALHSGREAFQGAMLTPAGMNVANFDFSPSRQDITTQMALGDLLSPAQLMAYLELVYTPLTALRTALRDGWCIAEEHRVRHFLRTCGDAASAPIYTIHYSGDAPWYATIRVQDRLQNRVLTLKILEVGNVLSE